MTRDPACAVEGRAQYLVSDHKNLLDLGEYEGIQTVTLRDLIDIPGLL